MLPGRVHQNGHGLITKNVVMKQIQVVFMVYYMQVGPQIHKARTRYNSLFYMSAVRKEQMPCN